MTNATLIQFRMDENLKNETQSILEDLGLDMPTAFRMFCKKIVSVGGIPFSLISQMKEKKDSSKSWKVWMDAREEIRKNNVPEMSLDEINAEIDEARKILAEKEGITKWLNMWL